MELKYVLYFHVTREADTPPKKTRSYIHQAKLFDFYQRFMTATGQQSQCIAVYLHSRRTRRERFRVSSVLEKALDRAKQENAELWFSDLTACTTDPDTLDHILGQGVRIVSVRDGGKPNPVALGIRHYEEKVLTQLRTMKTSGKEASTPRKPTGIKAAKVNRLRTDAYARRAMEWIDEVRIALPEKDRDNFSKIAAALNEAGRFTRRGATWQGQTVMRIMQRTDKLSH
tara:strand:+ start:3262 stop:3945 length:684 start_codon:yes stop_codon:yes gene_type:complete